jgi:molybdopterin-binding protein
MPNLSRGSQKECVRKWKPKCRTSVHYDLLRLSFLPRYGRSGKWYGFFRWLGVFSLLMTLSARNRLAGKVVEIQFGGVMAHVVVSVGNNLIESVITKRSADEMKLKVGDTVSAVIKSTEVMLEKS